MFIELKVLGTGYVMVCYSEFADLYKQNNLNVNQYNL